MSAYSLTHLSDQTLLRELSALVARERATTATLLAHISEVDARRLYLPAAYPSMYLYCIHELRLSEDSAFKRIRAARAARRFPVIFAAMACGKLHLSAVVLLAPYLTEGTFRDLIEGATHKTKAEIEQLLAQRFPRPDLPEFVRAFAPQAPAPPTGQLAPGPVEASSPDRLAVGAVAPSQDRPAVGSVAPSSLASSTCFGGAGHIAAPPTVEVPSETVAAGFPLAKVTPLSPGRLGVQLTIGKRTHDRLLYAQQLLSHQVPSANLAEVVDRALNALIRELEKTKFAATERPLKVPRPSTPGTRHVPNEVKRAVWKRDQGRCTFVSEKGRRCPSRTLLEYDHVVEVARGGQATTRLVRLRCRAHNQYGAECTFGAEFMRAKREQAREAAAKATGEVKSAVVVSPNVPACESGSAAPSSLVVTTTFPASFPLLE